MRQRSILIIEDDADDRFMIRDSFERIQWSQHITTVSSAKEAFQLLDTAADRDGLPGLILIDYHMPQLNGEGTLRILKEHPRYREIPVYVYSTEMTDALERRLRLLGAAACHKKFDTSSAGIRLAQLLRGAASTNSA